MPSIEELELRIRFLESRIGQWALNGLDSFDGLNALEFGNASSRLSPLGYQIKVSTNVEHPPIITPNNAGVIFVPMLLNSETVSTYPFAALWGNYDSSDGNVGIIIGSKAAGGDLAEAYVAAYGSSTDANSHIKGAVFSNTVGGDVRWNLDQVAFTLSNVPLQLHSGTTDLANAATAAAVGQMVYRSDTDHFRGRSGAQWVDFATMGAVAGTLPEPVYLLASSNTSVNNKSNNTEHTFISATIPAKTIQSAGNIARAVRVRSGGKYINNSGAGRTARLRVKFGGTTYWDDTTASIGASATEAAWMFECTLAGLSGSDSTQTMFGRFTLGAQAAATTGWGDLVTLDQVSTTFYGEPAKDSTADQTFAFTILNSASDANLGFTQTFYSVEVI